VVTAPYTAPPSRSCALLKSGAATISAMHCATPPRRLSFLASTMATTGASMANCSGERLRRKSQNPVSPRAASTVNSVPEKSPRALLRCRRTSMSTGAMMSSERAFPVEIAKASGAPSASASRSCWLTATGAMCVKTSVASSTTSAKSRLSCSRVKAL